MSSGSSDEKVVPIGLVLLSIGFIIFLTAAIVWLYRPAIIPERLQLASLPPTPLPTAAQPEIPAGQTAEENGAVLLPQTPLEANGGLPSFASVNEAPTSYIQPVSGQPTRLQIPALGIDANVTRVGLQTIQASGQRYYQWQVPNGYSAGWHETSARLGQAGNTVLNGHNNIYGELFRDLIDLQIGDEIIIYDEERAYRYQVIQQELLPENDQPIEVRLQNARWIEPTNDERITLVSCWPYATNNHRLVVIARPVNESAQ